MPNTAAVSRRPVAIVVFYGNGTTWTIPEAALSTPTAALSAWRAFPGDDVQVVVAFEARTFDHWSGQHYDADGNPLPLQWIEGEHYKTVFSRVDYYWMDADGGVGGGQAAEVPGGLPPGAVKAGKWMDKDAFLEIEGIAHEMRRP